MKPEQVDELLYQALETELGGVEIYTTTAGIPPRYRSGDMECGAILFWTRQRPKR